METSSSDKLGLYLITLVIELITGVFRMLFTIPLTMLLFIIVLWVLSKIGIEPVDVFRLNADLQYSQRFLWVIVGVAAILAYANIIASVVAYLGFGGGSLMTRFVLGARKPSTREQDAIFQVFEQMADGADSPISSYSKLYVIDSVLEFANLVGTTLYVSSSSFRGNNLQALIAHEFGHLNNGDGSLILALRRLVFPPFSLFIGGIRDFSTNRPAYQPDVKEFDAIQIFYSMINNIIFFTLAFIGGGIGVWVMSWAWASYFRARDYVADSFAAGLGYRDLLLRYLETNIYFDTSVPYMLGWRPAAELRIDALQHPGSYGLPVYDDATAAAAAGAAFAPLSDVEPETERPATATVAGTDNQRSSSSKTLRNYFIIAIIVVAAYLLVRSLPVIWATITERTQELSSMVTNPFAELSSPFVINTSSSDQVAAQEPVATAVAGLVYCPVFGETGKGVELNWQISVPEGEIAFINAQEFDVLEGELFVTVTGPYEGQHRVKDAAYCGGIPANADYTAVRSQRLALLTPPYQHVVIPGQTETADERGAANAIAVPSDPYDCSSTVAASRDLIQHGSDESCWLQLMDGATAEIMFNDEAQITYRTASSGNDVYFYIASAGERLTDVIGATIRPIPFVQSTYGGYEEVKAFEVQYHSPGGRWVTCLRDAGNNYQALNSECEDEVAENEVAIEAYNPDDPFPGWVICRHGRSDREFLVAYPEAEARNGIDLNGKISFNPWYEREEDLANDSLKMCYYKGDWYGSSNLAWFPTVSYLQLLENQMVVCEHSDCVGDSWPMLPGAASDVQIGGYVPKQPGIHLLDHWPS